jgi:molybdopterin-synthase adenylyltransferase
LRPVLLKHYRLRVEPSESGDSSRLIFTSERKRFAIRGRSLDVFVERVVPLLDGQLTLDEIKERMADVFAPQDLHDSLSLLAQQRIVKDAERDDLSRDTQLRLAPELSYLSEVAPDPSLFLDRLSEARVTVVGLGAVGVVAATALAAAGVGNLRCVDGSLVSPADPYLAQLFSADDVGRSRAETTREKVRAVSPSSSVEVVFDDLQTETEMAAVVGNSDFVLGCLDAGRVSTTHALNRACLAQRVVWSSATASAYEGIVGPTIIPYETACFRCYEARVVSCTDDPPATLADLRHRMDRNVDESPYRENLAFGAGIVGHLLALEAFKAVLGLRPPTAGRIVTVDFTTCEMRHSVVLRKPWCSACFSSAEL